MHLHSKRLADWLSQADSLSPGLIREGEVGLPVPTMLLHRALYPQSLKAMDMSLTVPKAGDLR